MPNLIRLLDDNTANRIAAGEVVERPASAVKELVENAIDAGATHVRVALEEGGKRRIEVSDDGCGMGAEDAVLALQRHATSKIRSADDLFDIRTLGFRGEALPSIASVSHFTLTTRASSSSAPGNEDGDAGVRISVHGGDIEWSEPVGTRAGTSVVVEELFYNTPARLKFLKSTPTELARAIDAVGTLAIAHPSVAFRISHNGQEILSTPGNGGALGALTAVWGRDIARRLVPLACDDADSPGLRVSGFLCTPDLTRPGRSHELFYVNRRPIRSRLLGHALEDAVRALTPESRYPIAAVFVEIAPSMVDVNVHPTKSEVKFTRDGEVHHAVSQAVKQTLLRHGIVPTLEVDGWEARRVDRRESGVRSREWLPQQPFGGAEFDALARAAVQAFAPPVTLPAFSPREPSHIAPAAAADTELTDVSSRIADPLDKQEATRTAEVSTVESGLATPRPFADQLRGFRVVGQARNTYIIAITDDGLAVIDQHVAHERVLYERLTVMRREQGIAAQRLAEPVTVSLGPAEAALLRQRLEDFAAAGWELEPFGRDAFLARAVPTYIAKRRWEPILRDMVDELAHQSVARRLIVQREHVTITNACKMAVKAGDPLTIEEMTGLLAQLSETENPYLCPHGRPIVVTVPFGEIDRKFKR